MLVGDMHCDTISCLYNAKKDESLHLDKNHLHLDIEKMKKGDYLFQNFAMFIFLKETTHPYQTCLEMIDLYYEEIGKNKEAIQPAYSYQDIIKNKEAGYMSSVLTIEEGGAIEGSLDKLHEFYQKGVRMMTLTWNFPNEIGYPNIPFPTKAFKDIRHYDEVNGLTDFGIQCIQEMEKIGMIIDVSHLSDAGFYDVYHHTNQPFVASHSNAREICHVGRNMSDDMIKCLAKRHGVMGINYCGDFLQDSEEGNAPSRIEDMVKHIEYIRDLVGIDTIALGSDFDGIDSSLELKDASYMPLLAQALYRHGFTQEDVEKIFYKNVLRVYQAVLK